MEAMQVSYQIVLVDDCGPDQSWSVMKQLAESAPQLKCVRLSRNFGQHPAIMAGLTHSDGKWVVVMDCDLQDQPKEIPRLYQKAIEGYEVVLASRKNRKDALWKRVSSKGFSLAVGYLTETAFDNTVANFGIYHRKVVDEVLQIPDFIKSFPLFVQWVGFRSTTIEVEHAERAAGKSSYSMRKLISLAFNTIISFSNKPLKLFTKFGLIVSTLSFAFGILTLYRYFRGDIQVLGYSSLMASIGFLFGVVITVIGVTGIYVGKIFDQTKGRKPFIIDEIHHTKK